jgi:hypothetical protein
MYLTVYNYIILLASEELRSMQLASSLHYMTLFVVITLINLYFPLPGKDIATLTDVTAIYREALRAVLYEVHYNSGMRQVF